jgi:hypothetical protein
MISAVARAEPLSPVIWYRSSEGCPDGAAFIARLRGAASAARLAEVTDRIDFVVTLGHSGSGSTGRLERQTSGSTVAIREIEAESCEAVADVLALTLTLALDPKAAPPAEGSAVPQPAATSALAATTTTSASDTPPVTRVDATPRSDVNEAKHESSRRSEPIWLLGGASGPLTGPTGAVGAWVGPFVELRPHFSVLPRMSMRLMGLYARSEDEDAEFAFTTAGGRFEACPTALGGRALDVRPCLGLELGVASGESFTSTGRGDSGTWFAANGFLRASWQAAPAFVLSLDAGAYAPLIRYTFASESGTKDHRANSIGFFAGIGAALVLR